MSWAVPLERETKLMPILVGWCEECDSYTYPPDAYCPSFDCPDDRYRYIEERDEDICLDTHCTLMWMYRCPGCERAFIKRDDLWEHDCPQNPQD